MLRLTDANSEFTIDYTLNFGVIGKIEIYKEFNPKYDAQALEQKHCLTIVNLEAVDKY